MENKTEKINIVLELSTDVIYPEPSELAWKRCQERNSVEENPARAKYREPDDGSMRVYEGDDVRYYVRLEDARQEEMRIRVVAALVTEEMVDATLDEMIACDDEQDLRVRARRIITAAFVAQFL